MSNIAGIDPGLVGAIAVMDSDDKRLVDSCSMPIIEREVDTGTLLDILTDWHVTHVFMEKAQAMPRQGVVSMFNYGLSYGMIRGALSAAKIPYTLVHPATWKRVMCKDMKRTKESSLVRVKQLYPELRLKSYEHDIADAILIAVYGLGLPSR